MLPLCSALIAAIALALALAATRAAGQTQPSNIAENTAGFSNARTGQSSGSNAKCITGNVDVDVGAQNSRSTLKAPDNNMALTQLIVEFTQVNSSVATTASAGPSNVNGTYSIYSEFCFPVDTAAQSKVQTLQILTHGGTLDNNYWDIASTNSYIEAAISAGYATFAYDRLGSGLSEHPDPVEVVQIPIQIELLHLIVQRFRDAKIGGRSFENVVGVGHSLGAALTQAVAAKYPRDFDALILQGISTSLQYAQTGVVSTGMQIANTDPSGRFSDLPSGYFSIAPVPQALQFAFYRYPNYRTEIFDAQRATLQTNTLGEMLTLGAAYLPAPEFRGPVDVVNGENDYFYCGGNCNIPQNQAALVQPAFFPSASKGSQSFLVPGAGHNVNLHKEAPKGFQQMIRFLRDNGL